MMIKTHTSDGGSTAIDSLDAGCIPKDVRVMHSESVREQLETLYKEHAQALFRFAVAILGSAEDAEDAVQDVFVRLARNASKQKTLRKQRHYLLAAVRNQCLSTIRSRVRSQKLIDEYAGQSDLSLVFKQDDSLEELQPVRKAVMSLPLDQREVVVLKIIEDLTFKEIAQLTGVSQNTCASRYRYGIAHLKRVLEGCDYG